jgi:hypothetical protein
VLAQVRSRGVMLGQHGKEFPKENKAAARERVSELRPVIRKTRKDGKTGVGRSCVNSTIAAPGFARR